MKKILVILIMVLVIGAFVSWKMRPEPLSVLVSPVTYGDVEKSVSNTRAGTIKACRRSKLSMPLGGVVDKLLVKKGDNVKSGDLLLELWNRDHYAGVDQAQGALSSARHSQQQMCTLAQRSSREAKRAATLLEQHLIAVDMADNLQSNSSAQQDACSAAKAQVASAEANLAMQKAVLERFQLRAPFDGVVAEINGEIGEYVTPSPPGVVTPPAVDLIDTSCLYATAPIDEVDAAALRMDMPVKITLDAFRDRVFKGKLSRIAPYVVDLEKQARTVDVDVRFDEVPTDVILLIGYSADVMVVIDNHTHVLNIPTEAILENDQVWVLNKDSSASDNKAVKGKLQKRKVKLGIGNFAKTEVLEGLQENDLVVRSPDQAGIADDVEAIGKYDE